uniref:Protein At-4/1 n=1 Tax=Kalanchoe fedtschenkoi TaxID=63787 RepID=A0A7N0VIJ1_KALFE
MAATGNGDLESLQSSFDQIYEDAVNAAQEIQLLRSSYNDEVSKCEALQLTCSSLKSGSDFERRFSYVSCAENERLTQLYMGFVSKLSDQIDYRSKCESLEDKLKRVSDECIRKNSEGKKAMQLIEQGYRERIENLEGQLRSLTIQKSGNQELIDHLRRDLATQKSHINVMVNKMETLHHSLELKYLQEVQDLKDCLMMEQEEKNGLNKKVEDLEKELLLSRMKIAEQQRDLNSNRNVEGLKDKIMKLRRENEVLKRKRKDEEC